MVIIKTFKALKLEQLYSNIIVSHKNATGEAIPIRSPFRQHIPAWNVAVSENDSD